MTSRPSSGILLLISVFLSLTFASPSFAQPGQLTVNQDPRIEQLVHKHIELNEKMLGVPGYRVQIFFASGNDSKDRASAVRNEALKSFSDYPSYMLFEAPYYKVRIGDFRTKLDAERELQKIRPVFPGAFIVEDVIRPPALALP